jgi:hypothetical protein
MHKVGLTYYEINVGESDTCRETCDKQGLLKAEINKMHRNMGFQRENNGRQNSVVTVSSEHTVSELFPTPNRTGSKVAHIKNPHILGHVPKVCSII